MGRNNGANSCRYDGWLLASLSTEAPRQAGGEGCRQRVHYESVMDDGRYDDADVMDDRFKVSPDLLFV